MPVPPQVLWRLTREAEMDLMVAGLATMAALAIWMTLLGMVALAAPRLWRALSTDIRTLREIEPVRLPAARRR